jgi:hypothetical protein
MYQLPLNMKIKISVSGFQHQQRIGMKYLIQTIGGIYTENMSMTNTHLICKEAKGPKYHKAIEWKLHVVNIDWLYHIVYHGYSGSNSGSSSSRSNSNHHNDEKDYGRIVRGRKGNIKGCEKQFSMSFLPRRVKPVMDSSGCAGGGAADGADGADGAGNNDNDPRNVERKKKKKSVASLLPASGGNNNANKRHKKLT